MITQVGPSGRVQLRAANRRGALFHYYLVYLLLTGSIMAAAGVCLHALLKSDEKDSRVAWHLQTLLRLERQLRADTGDSQTIALTDGKLLCRSEHDTDVSWAIDRNIITRTRGLRPETSDPGDPDDPGDSADRFVFTFGTRIAFEPRDGARIAVRIAELSAHAPILDSSVRRNREPPPDDGRETGSAISRDTAPRDTPPGTLEPFEVEIVLFGASAPPSPEPVPQEPVPQEPGAAVSVTPEDVPQEDVPKGATP